MRLAPCTQTGLLVPEGAHAGRIVGECVHAQRLREVVEEHRERGLPLPIMGGQRCGCSTPEITGCQCSGQSSDTVALSGTASAGNPWTWDVILNPDPNNSLSVSAAGLFAPPFPAPPFAPRMFSTTLSGGPTSGSIELNLGSLNVPAFSVPTFQMVQAGWLGRTDANGANDSWFFRVRESGVVIGQAEIELQALGAASSSLPFSIPSRRRSVAASTAQTYVASIQRDTGDGTINSRAAGTSSGLAVMVIAQ